MVAGLRRFDIKRQDAPPASVNAMAARFRLALSSALGSPPRAFSAARIPARAAMTFVSALVWPRGDFWTVVLGTKTKTKTRKPLCKKETDH